MSAVRVFQSISSVFPWNNGGQSEPDNDDSDDRLLKRRKTQTTGGVNSSARCTFNGTMRMKSNLSCTSTASSSDMSEEWLSDDTMTDSNDSMYSPRITLTRSLADRGMPSRLDPYSIDHCVHFEGSEDIANGRAQAIPMELVAAMQHHHHHQHQLIHRLQNFGNSNYLKSLRTSEGETLLHLAASTGCHAVVERLLQADMQLPTMVLDRHGRTPLHSLCLSMSRNDGHTMQHQHLETMRVLLRHSPTLVLYMDQEKKTPLEYLHGQHHQVSDLLFQDQVVERVAQEMSRQMHSAHSGQRMSAMERVDRMVNLSGVDAAIMETGFSI